LVQDTTTLDYSSHDETEGLGNNTRYTKGKGLLLHTTMALSGAGMPLGIMAQKYWTRDPDEWGKKIRRKKSGIEDKESYRWLEALEESNEGIPGDILTVTIADREADIYDLFHAAQNSGHHVLIRAVGTRKVESETQSVYAEVKARQPEKELEITIPRNSRLKQSERTARLALRYCAVKIKPPRHRSQDKSLPMVELYAVCANEEHPPEGVAPISWLLLTTIPVVSYEEAVEKVRWYKHRWLIERFHYTLKSGCTVEELQLETADRLKNAIALYSIIAWKILWLVYEVRLNPDINCEKVMSTHEWQCAYCMVHEVPDPPAHPPTLREAMLLVARLGGFMCRKGDGDPGVKVLWHGYTRVRDLASFWNIKSASPQINVGNG
jgi:hypothetical protein